MSDQRLAAVLKLNAVSSANLNIMCIIYCVGCLSLVIQNCPNYAARVHVASQNTCRSVNLGKKC